MIIFRHQIMWMFIVHLTVGCSSNGGSNSDDDFEGDNPDECNDRADNDQDGLFDCDDSDCIGSPACSGTDDNDNADTDTNQVDSEQYTDESSDTDTDTELGTADPMDTNAADTSVGDNDDSDPFGTDSSSHTDTNVEPDSEDATDSIDYTDTNTLEDTDTAVHVDTEPEDTDSFGPPTDTETGPPVTGSSDEVAPMPVISRDVPAYTSSLGGGSPNDEFYGTTWLSDGGLPIWLTYDLSAVPVERRGWVVVHWINSDYWYTNDWGDEEGPTPMWCPSEYTIDAHTAAGGADPPSPTDPGWTSLVTLPSPNVFKQRQHVVNLTPGDTVYNWIRLNVTGIMGDWESIDINMDVHDAHLGVEDSWFFAGDSITAGGMTPYELDDANFSQIVNQAMPEYFPATVNAGVPGWTTYDGAKFIPGWLEYFPGKYVGLAFGTNDTARHTPHDEFYANYEVMVRAVLDAGKVPIIPTIPWFREDGVELVPGFNDVIAQIKEDYPDILDGPDLWTHFSEHQQLISEDNLHPSEEGYNVYRRLWAEHALDTIYNFQPNE